MKCTTGSFPTLATSYIDPSTINSQAFSYQMADFDAKRNRVLFYPYGSVTPPTGTSGIFLTYDVAGNDFTNTMNWTATDLSMVVDPKAVDFGGGFIDTDDRFAYLCAGSQTGDPVAVKIDLALQAADPTASMAYTAFHPRTIPSIPYVGSFSGVFAAEYA